MKKRLLILLLTVCFLAEAEAQHCGWDFTDVIMVDVMRKGGEGTIGGLKVTLVDAWGKCVSTYTDSCLQFVQNIPTDSKPLPHVRQSDLKYRRPSFFFVQEQYVMLVYSKWEDANLYVKVEDIDGEHNGGYFETVIVPVKKENFVSLCGKNWYPADHMSWVEPALIKIELGDAITLGNRRQGKKAESVR